MAPSADLPILRPSAVVKSGVQDQIDYVSTGGGAFLEMLEGKTLPAIAILQERADG